MIEYIEIKSLHNERDVKLSFDGNIKILVGDNGSGKTTVLSCLYSILSLNFHKLSKIQFKDISIKFTSGDLFKISKNDVGASEYIEALEHPIISEFVKYLSPDETIEVLKIVRDLPYPKGRNHPLLRRVNRKTHRNPREVYERFQHVSDSMSERSSEGAFLKEQKELIKRNVSEEIMYLPTYRRVEEDLSSLGYLDDDFDGRDQLIQFGMADVKSRFNKVKSELKDSAVELYTNLNGKVLNQLASDYKADNEQFSKIKKIEDLNIVLSRVGDSISDDSRERIISLVENDQIQDVRYHPLVFVLSNLIDVYNEQKELEDSIKQFVKVTKKYLVDKTFEYDENKVDINIINKRTKKPVSLDNLSSGEKQLVSLFSKLYLDQVDAYVIIFDEPELSLSMEWQETLLPDILATGRVNFLLAATHSPFIFENDLDPLTGSLEVKYVEEEDATC